MSRSQLIDHYTKVMSAEHDVSLSKKAAGEQIDSLFQAIGNVLEEHEKLTIVGFCTLSAVKRGERKGRNPKTGAEMTIPESKSVKFKIGKNLKDRLNRKK